MSEANFKYSVDTADFVNAYEIESAFDEGCLDWLAEECAEDYHSHHDGWESSWPLDFFIFDLEGKLLGTVEVERETVPNFVGTLKEKAA